MNPHCENRKETKDKVSNLQKDKSAKYAELEQQQNQKICLAERNIVMHIRPVQQFRSKINI